ncbi:unnamed protein product [Timema podura]|uniref:Uncharacterized protein n=1 Tax=Timema podura TaxID=61482 RepID=A0ABN7PK37_TIMPD|nr:unnamed protein product [Timema podura]
MTNQLLNMKRTIEMMMKMMKKNYQQNLKTRPMIAPAQHNQILQTIVSGNLQRVTLKEHFDAALAHKPSLSNFTFAEAPGTSAQKMLQTTRTRHSLKRRRKKKRKLK